MFQLMNSLLALFRPRDLEHIPDREFLRLLTKAAVRRGDAAWVIPVLVGCIAAAAWVGVGLVLAVLLKRPNAPVNWPRVGVLNVLIGCVIAWAIAGVVRWRLLTTSIRYMLNKAVCPYCDFSLIGLKVDMGGVQCPECGERVVLHEQGLIPEDLLPDTPGARPPFAGAGPLGAYVPQPALSTKGGKKIRHQPGGVLKPKRKPPQSGNNPDVLL